MKILNTVQELWTYCLFCPVCQDLTRKISIAVGPDEAFQIYSFQKDNDILQLQCSLTVKNKKYNALYYINCHNNSFKVDISDPQLGELSVEKASSPYFYFYIMSDCRQCDATHTNGTDIELDMNKGTLHNIGVEREGIYLLEQKIKYHITYEHDRNKMQISKCFEDENTNEIIDDNKPFNFPIIDFDFSNQQKVLNKIKTLLVFS